MEHRDLLRVAVLEHLEIILLERGNRRSTGVGHGGEDVHQLYIHLEGCVGLIVRVCGLLFGHVGRMSNSGRRRLRQRRWRTRHRALG